MMETNAPNVYPVWGSLQPGPYAVGFRRRLQRDFARTYPWPESTAAAPTQTARPILVNIWYPALTGDHEQCMTLGDYLAIDIDAAEALPFVTALTRFTTERVGAYLFGKPFARLGDRDLATYQRIKALPCRAIRNATAVAERFPLLLYHQGIEGTVEDNLVLCEYLASHGYVVVNSAYQPAIGPGLVIDLDLTRSIKDLDCLINSMAEEPNVDPYRIGMVGHSYGAETAFAYRAEPNSPIHALVSLDSTLEYAPIAGSDYEREWVAPLHARVLANANNLSIPMLVVARQSERDGSPILDDEDNPVPTSFVFCDKLVNAERHYMSFTNMGHNDLISQGVFSCEHALQLPNAPAIREGYDLLCQAVLAFCNTHVKGGSDDTHFSAWLRKQALMPPPLYSYRHRTNDSEFR